MTRSPARPEHRNPTGFDRRMQLPSMVSRAVVASAACRLSDPGRRALTRFADQARTGRPRRAWAALAPAIGTGPVTRRLMAPLLAANVGSGTDPADMLATAGAGLAFDVTGELPRISVPTLVIGGGRDGFFSPELFHETAAGIPDAEVLLEPRRGHLGAVLRADDVRGWRRSTVSLTGSVLAQHPDGR